MASFPAKIYSLSNSLLQELVAMYLKFKMIIMTETWKFTMGIIMQFKEQLKKMIIVNHCQLMVNLFKMRQQNRKYHKKILIK